MRAKYLLSFVFLFSILFSGVCFGGELQEMSHMVMGDRGELSCCDFDSVDSDELYVHNSGVGESSLLKLDSTNAEAFEDRTKLFSALPSDLAIILTGIIFKLE